MRWRRALVVVVLVVPVAIVLAWPRVCFWRLRYWIERNENALWGLMEATPDGGWLELRHAARCGNEMLRRDAALYLVKRGDAEGVRILVEFCYKNPYGCLKWSPQQTLGETVVEGDPRLDAFPDAAAWWEARSPALHYLGDGRWRIERLGGT